MSDAEQDLLLKVDHVKYRKAGEGRSPVGRLLVYKEYVEWRDNTSPEVLNLKFMHIKGQRVSPPHKAKVQLQLILQNDDQATFVFLNPDLDKNGQAKERDAVKETLQQALIAHRARVNQLAASAKQKLLWQNKQLEQLYKHLVSTKLISPQDFWADYYKNEGMVEDKAGISGAFLANIAQQEGANGVKLNLNAEIIQAIFNTYPAVEQKHLELVPHEMTETQFWSKFFQSHYFHRERDVMPNPKDPFADCVKNDDAEIGKMLADGVNRKRFDLDHLDDNSLRDFLHKSESQPKSTKQTLIRRCNYLSEKIVQTSSLLTGNQQPSGSAQNGESSTSLGRPRGFAALGKIVADDETRLESEELQETVEESDIQPIRIDEQSIAERKTYPPKDAKMYKSLVLSLFDDKTDEDILSGTGDLIDFDDSHTKNGVMKNGNSKEVNGCPPPEKWGLPPTDLAELKAVHSSAKIERMEQTLTKYETEQLSEFAKRFGRSNIEHCSNMILRAHERYKLTGAALLSKSHQNQTIRRRWLTTSTGEEDASTSSEDVPATLRPDLDFDFLLDDANLQKIRKNIQERKGVGNIDAVREKWAAIQELMNSGGKPPGMTEAKYAQMWSELYDEALAIPNMSEDSVPRGGIEQAKVLAEWGTKREDDCLTAEKLVQPWRALFHPTEASGQRSYVFTGPLARLESALLDYAYERANVLGFKPISVSDIVSGDVTAACGLSQRSDQNIQYSLLKEPSVKLSGTAEMGIAAFMRGRTFLEEQMPVRVIALSRCFRPEISKSASEAKLYRVHEFTKVEMFTVCTPEQSQAELDFLTQIQKGTFEALGIHCRQLEMPTEELGAPAARKIDVEAWMPGRKLRGDLVSNTRRKMELRGSPTCNGTALATTRAIIALLETIQNEKKGIADLPDVIAHRIKKERFPPIRFQPAKPLN
ncbi:unnamed protein product [Caenorhabditis auriculariae]|uniref:Serine--tRNA ligase n=1 Tax=Caenorhabditis auriculariae TaxID=2777116 RepID=A0A8S1HIT0_9PELO|nr:unnamed protein product [Caenorhabditis auriculariae]